LTWALSGDDQEDAVEAPPSTAPPVPAIECRSISRAFGATRALSDVDLDLAAGRVHALVGENGAGKSTLFGILSGRIAASSGEIRIHGKPLAGGDPRLARRHGIAAVYQELTIVPGLSAVANAYLGQELRQAGLLDEGSMHRRFGDLAASLGIDVVPGARAGSLPVGQQQLIEIARSLISDARILLLDEPTTALAEHERRALFGVIRQLRERGVTVVLVSHNLDEVLLVSDTVTVLRNGRLIATRPAEAWTKRDLVAAMLGHALEEAPVRQRSEPGPAVLAAADVDVPGAVEQVAVSVAAGEILGLAGLVGSGRTTLMRALAGLEPASGGRLEIRGRQVRWPRDVREAQRHGIVLLPEDRKLGLVPRMSAADNVSLGAWGSAARAWMVDVGRQRELVRGLAARFGFDAGRVGSRLGDLSGGNQQKVLLAKSVHKGPLVLLADEPTRGIDVGAKAEVLRTLVALAEEGLAVVVASSELEEVLEIADRILVLNLGRMGGELSRGDAAWSVQGILHKAFDVEPAA
jgi:ribose transport system ATP-binding protein/rhamnose transport system ATP-binding protein